MKMINFIRRVVFVGIIILQSCGNSGISNKQHIIEIERPLELSTVIGKQEWMTRNLNVSKFRNGDIILEAKSAYEWKSAADNGIPAWCYHYNDPDLGEMCGKLYNWYAVNDKRGLAPEGWRIPSENDWNKLLSFLGKLNSGKMLKNDNGWIPKSFNGNNETGFSAIPGGKRGYHGKFLINYSSTYWWTSSEENETYVYLFFVTNSSGLLYKYSYLKGAGMSVRCIREVNKKIDQNKSLRKNNKNYNFKTVQIGNQIWMAENLNIDIGEGCIQVGLTESEINENGLVYNYEAAIEAAVKIEGWHLPTEDEWVQLIEHLGGEELAFNKLIKGRKSSFNASVEKTTMLTSKSRN